MKKLLLTLLLGLSSLYAISMEPSTINFKENRTLFKLINAKNIPVAIYFEIKKLEKDKHGKITEHELDEVPFVLKPQFVLKSGASKKVRIKYTKKITDIEEVYSISVKEMLLGIDTNKKINSKNNFKTKIYVGGTRDKKPTCSVEGKDITIHNPNTKHVYITREHIIVNGKNINKDLKRIELLGWYLPSGDNTRTTKLDFPENSTCEIVKVKGVK